MRLGGDEFCVVLLNCSQETMQEKFRNIHEAFRREVAGDYPKSFRLYSYITSSALCRISSVETISCLSGSSIIP